jgi:hypothetical protein
MKTIKNAILVIMFLIVVQGGISQGFFNMNFESGNPSGFSPGSPNVPTTSALPDWTAYYSTSTATNQTSQAWYDSVSLGGAFISLEDTNANSFGPAPLQGIYSVLLEGSTANTPTAASIGQTGQIPLNTLSVTFFLSLDSNLQVTFNGQLIPLVQIGSTPNYDIMGGNISAFAGQAGQLLFTALPGTGINAGYGVLDNIQFSSLPVPERGTLALCALGALSFALCRRKRTPARNFSASTNLVQLNGRSPRGLGRGPGWRFGTP